MIFPHNIDVIIQKSKKSSSKDLTMLGLVLIIIFDLGFMFTIGTSLQESYGIPMLLSFLFILILDIVVGFTLFRIFVVNERDQVKEFENSKDDSLSRYYFIREREIPKMVDGIEVFENVDGNFFVVLQIFYGPNDKDKCEGTHRFFTKLFDFTANYCIDFKTYVARECFSESVECKRFLNGIGNSDNDKLTRTMLEVSDAVLDFTDKNSQLYSTYLMIRMTPFQLSGLKALSSEISVTLNNDLTSIRNFEFLDKKRFRDFVREYHNVEALDLSNIRNPQVSAQLMRTYGSTMCTPEEYNYKFNTGVKVYD